MTAALQPTDDASLPNQVTAPGEDLSLTDAVALTWNDPLAFVYLNWEWGVGPLAGQDGPDKWQIDVLNTIAKHIEQGGNAAEGLQIAVASGHGIGKTALIAWIVIWFIAVHPNPQIIVTANTMRQLSGKTWREVAKWNKVGRCNSWFKWTATQFYRVGHADTWKAEAIPWSKERSVAFQGAHEKYILIIYDEAAIIDDSIWEATEGAMTTAGAMWIVFGNPNLNTGRFRECFGKFKHRWIHKQIDSRTAKMADRRQIQKWIEDYGEDSDFVRVRVKGQFPRAASNQLISSELVELAKQRRKPSEEELAGWPKLLGVDVARDGDDQSVICFRQHNYMKIIKRYRERDTMQLAALVAEQVRELGIDHIFVDVVGIGAGVVDRLRQMGFSVFAVVSGETALQDDRYFNKRAECWVQMRDWLKAGGCLEDDQELTDDLIGPQYGYDERERYQIERKKDMKKRGLASPDSGDALAFTFAEPVAQKMIPTKLTSVQKALMGIRSGGNGSWMGRT
jgi:hypothetical protein